MLQERPRYTSQLLQWPFPPPRSEVYNPLSVPAAPSSRPEVTTPPAAQHSHFSAFQTPALKRSGCRNNKYHLNIEQVPAKGQPGDHWSGRGRGEQEPVETPDAGRQQCTASTRGSPGPDKRVDTLEGTWCLVKSWAFEVYLSNPGYRHPEMPGSLPCTTMWCPKISLLPRVIFLFFWGLS